MLVLSLRRRLLLCTVLAVLLLSAAYALQYLLGYQPCSLCLKQRIVWWAVLFCAALALLLSDAPRVLRLMPCVFMPCVFVTATLLVSLLTSLLLLAGGTLAVFHAGGERGLWTLTLLCEGFAFDPDLTTQDLRSLLLARKPVSCDEPALRLFWLSLSEYNALFSFSVLGWLAHGVWRGVSRRT